VNASLLRWAAWLAAALADTPAAAWAESCEMQHRGMATAAAVAAAAAAAATVAVAVLVYRTRPWCDAMAREYYAGTRSHPHVASKCCTSVVLPEPRNPVITSAGTTTTAEKSINKNVSASALQLLSSKLLLLPLLLL
jgi:hypothetical protein